MSSSCTCSLTVRFGPSLLNLWVLPGHLLLYLGFSSHLLADDPQISICKESLSLSSWSMHTSTKCQVGPSNSLGTAYPSSWAHSLRVTDTNHPPCYPGQILSVPLDPTDSLPPSQMVSGRIAYLLRTSQICPLLSIPLPKAIKSTIISLLVYNRPSRFPYFQEILLWCPAHNLLAQPRGLGQLRWTVPIHSQAFLPQVPESLP